jgi:hypothetical protein
MSPKSTKAGKSNSGSSEQQTKIPESRIQNTPIAIYSYTELISCNGKFDIPFNGRSAGTEAETWSTIVHLDKSSIYNKKN